MLSSRSSSSHFLLVDMHSSSEFLDLVRPRLSGHLLTYSDSRLDVYHSPLISSRLISQAVRYIVRGSEHSRYASDRYSQASSSPMRSTALRPRYNLLSSKPWRRKKSPSVMRHSHFPLLLSYSRHRILSNTKGHIRFLKHSSTASSCV